MAEQEMLNKILTKVIEIDDRLDSFVTKDDLAATENKILTDFDRFVKLHETLDQELVALRSKYDRLEERLTLIEQKIGI